jgi:hypothetical protein
MVHAVVIFYITTFWEDKKNICVLCSNVIIQLPENFRLSVFAKIFVFCENFRENFFTQIDENSRNINYADYLGNGTQDRIMFTKVGFLNIIL